MLKNSKNKINVICNFSKARSRAELFNEVCKNLYDENLISDIKRVSEAIIKRENQESTNFGEGFAIAHVQNKYILKPICAFISMKPVKELKYDEKGNVKFVIFLLLPEIVAMNHIMLLSKVSEFLLNKENHKLIYNLDKTKIIKKINDLYFRIDENAKNMSIVSYEPKNRSNFSEVPLDIVAVTSCYSGFSRCSLARNSIIRASNKLGFNLKCESQTVDGVENKLSRQDISNADLVILALGTEIDESRFKNKEIYRISLNRVILDGENVLIQAAKYHESITAEKKDSKKKDINMDIEKIKNTSENKVDKNMQKKIKTGKWKGSKFKKIIYNFFNSKNSKFKFKYILNDLNNGLLDGVSRIIPLIVIAGVFLSVSIAIGGAINSGSTNPYSYILFNKPDIFHIFYIISNASFMLVFALLGAYVGSSIGGKNAFAPSFILTWISNLLVSNNKSVESYNQLNFTMFNYVNGKFGLPCEQMGFIGAIVFGVICGYIMKIINHFSQFKNNNNSLYISVIYPIIVTIVGWFILSFIISFPLSYFIFLVRHFVVFLIGKNIPFVLGPVIGIFMTVDLGGLLNKLAFLTSVSVYSSQATSDFGGHMLAMVGAAAGIPTLGMAAYSVLGKKIFNCADREDLNLAYPAFILGFLGITEGAIPYAIKYPKSAFISNMLGGCIASTITGVAMVSSHITTNSFIVYIFSGIGKTNTSPDYLYGLIYIFAIIVGMLATCFSMLYLTKIIYFKDTNIRYSYSGYVNLLSNIHTPINGEKILKNISDFKDIKEIGGLEKKSDKNG